MVKQRGFFDVEERLACLRELGYQLDAFSQTIEAKACVCPLIRSDVQNLDDLDAE